jgi:hypothetical protein
MNRRALVTVVWSLIAIGVLFLSGVLVTSFWPSERAKANDITLEIPLPIVGTYSEVQGKHARLIIVHSNPGSLLAFALPTHEGKVGMPDRHWWGKPIYLCQDLRFLPTDPLTPNSTLECRDVETPESWKLHWRWTVDGKAIPSANGFDALRSVHVDVVGNIVRIHRWDIGA